MAILAACSPGTARRRGSFLATRRPAVPAASSTGDDLPSAKDMRPTLGLAERPLGPARWKYYSTADLYRAIREGEPYPVRAVIGFGANMLLAHADGGSGREALKQ